MLKKVRDELVAEGIDFSPADSLLTVAFGTPGGVPFDVIIFPRCDDTCLPGLVATIHAGVLAFQRSIRWRLLR